MKVLYISGASRSGSTLLCRLLGGCDGFVAVGELVKSLSRGLGGMQLCGCGARVSECSFWSAVSKRSGMDLTSPDGSVVHQPLPSKDRPLGIRRRLSGAPEPASDRGRVAAIYRAVQQQSGCSIIVDSSKEDAHGQYLSSIGEIELYTVHLVRDPRATAYSWMRKRLVDPSADTMMVRQPAFRSARRWMAANIRSELQGRRRPERYMFLRYEDLVADPRAAVQASAALVDAEPTRSPIDDEGFATLKTEHMVWGNPSRFDVGTVPIRPDEAWVDEMTARDKLSVTALTLPSLLRYGYPVLPARRALFGGFDT